MKYLHGMLVYVGVAILLVGCQSRKEEIKTTGITTIRFAVWGLPSEVEIHNRMIELFEKRYPHIKVKTEFIHHTKYQQKIVTQYTVGMAPDVIQLATSDLATYVSKGMLENLDPYIVEDREINLDDFPANLLESAKIKGKLYSLPKYVDPFILYYNKDLFDAVGLKYPDENWNRDDFLEAAQKLTKGEGPAKQYGYGTWEPYSWIWQNGGRIFNEEGTKCIFDSPEAIEAFQFYCDLQLPKKYGVRAINILQVEEGLEEMFARGRIAMMTNGAWSIPVLRKVKDLRWDIALPPRGKLRVTRLEVTCSAITKGTKHSREAWEFIKFLSSSENQNKVILKQASSLPVLKSILTSEAFLNQPSPPQNRYVFVEAVMKYGRVVPNIPNWREIQSILWEVADLAQIGQISAEKALKRAVRKINALLEKYR